MTEQENQIKIENIEEYYQKQIDLRNKLILRLLAETEPPCDECALKAVCVGGAKYEACAMGLLLGGKQ